MHIVCCYSTLKPETAASIEAYAPQIEFRKTEGLYGYVEIMAELWNGQDDLVIIEGDKVITKDVIPDFENCPHLWCSNTYFDGAPQVIGLNIKRYEIETGLGCARFRAELQREIPASEFLHGDPKGLWVPCPLCNGEGCWNYLDMRMSIAFESHGLKVHPHAMIEHVHDYSVNPDDWDWKTRETMRIIDNELAGPDWPYRCE